MNANELADELERLNKMSLFDFDAAFDRKKADEMVNMLRQQQAEIEAVKESNKNLMELVTMLREEVNSLRQQQAENEALKTKLQLHEAMDKQCESLMRQIKKDDDDWKLTREYCS